MLWRLKEAPFMVGTRRGHMLLWGGVQCGQFPAIGFQTLNNGSASSETALL